VKTGILAILGCLMLIVLASAPTTTVNAAPLAQATIPAPSSTPRTLRLPLTCKALVWPTLYDPDATHTPTRTFTVTRTRTPTHTPGTPTETPQPGVSTGVFHFETNWDRLRGWYVWVDGIVTNTHSSSIEIDSVECHVLDADGQEMAVSSLSACQPLIGAFGRGVVTGRVEIAEPADRVPTSARIVPTWHFSDKRQAELPTEHWLECGYVVDIPVTNLNVRVTNPYSRRISGQLYIVVPSYFVSDCPARFTLEPGASFVGSQILCGQYPCTAYYTYWAVFDPDEVLPTLTPTITPTPTPEGCLISRDSFQSLPFWAQTGTFTAEFDVTLPNTVCENGLDAVIGLSKTRTTTHSQLGPIVGFSAPLDTTYGCVSSYRYRVDARDGDEYRADNPIPDGYGKEIHVRMVVNIPAHTYSVYVSAPGKPEITIATDYAFRTEQSSVTSLGYWGVWSGSSWVEACDLEVTSGS